MKKRPFTLINTAITADGKIAPATRKFETFSTQYDQDLLYTLRAGADAVICGARTIDLMPVKLGTGGDKYRRIRVRRGLSEYPLRIVVSGAGTLDPKSEIFKHHFSPIVILTTGRISRKRLNTLRAQADEVIIFGERELDFRAAWRWLYEKWKVRRLVCEGGGELNSALLRAGVVDEVYLTICPVIFGGRGAPTLADGTDPTALSDAIPLKLKSMKRVGDEMYFILKPQNAI